MKINEKISNSDEDSFELSSEELDGIIFIPSDFSETIKCNSDVEPSDVRQEVGNLAEKLSIDIDLLYDLITPTFSGSGYSNHSNYIGFDDIEVSELKFYDKLEESDGDSLEEIEELQDENERLKEELEEYKDEVEVYEEEVEEYEEKIEEYKEEEKTNLSEKIVEIRKNKGLLDDECDCDEEVEELKEFSKDVLEKLLKDAEKISKKLSEPQPQVNEDNTSEKYESKKESLRREMFGEGE